MPKIRYLNKTRKRIPSIYSEKSGNILQNMNFSRCYRNGDKAIYGFDPNIIGLCYYYLNQYDEAIKNYRIALRISETVNGKGSVDSAYIYNNIGAVYSENGKPQDAIKEHKRALQIYENAFPEKMNLDLAQTYNDLADASLRLGDLDSCMDYLNNAFPIYEGMLPENSYKLLSPYSILANLLVEANDFIQAEIIYGHILWLMIENGYEETSASVQEFAARLEEIKALAEKQKETNES